MKGKNLVTEWDGIKREWGLFRKLAGDSTRLRFVRWIGNHEDVARYCRAYGNVEFPSYLQPVAERMKAEDEAAREVRMKAQAEANAQEIERREK